MKLASFEVFAGNVIHRVSEDWSVTCAGHARSCWRAVHYILACHAVWDSVAAAIALVPDAIGNFATSSGWLLTPHRITRGPAAISVGAEW